MINASIVFKKAIAVVALGKFLIFRFFSESLGVADSQAKAIGKASSDSVGASDESVAAMGKNPSDSSALSDSLINSIGRGLSDTIGASDAGSVRGQNYCAFDYFDADYVGYSQSF